MRLPSVLLSAAACCAAALAAPAAAPAQDDVLVRVDRPTPIAAHAGRLAWSERVPGTGRFALMTRAGGVTAPVPVAPRDVPFDVDLGPGPDGGVAAVYSRCERDPPVGGIAPAPYLAGRGCDVYRFSFTTGQEVAMREVNSTTASEAWPTIWRSGLAFARAYDQGRAYPYLYWNDVADAAGSRRMPGGQRRACSSRGCTDGGRSAPAALELYGRRLAFSWRYVGFAEGFAYDLRVDDVRSRTGDPRRIDGFGGGGLTGRIFGWPGFEAGRLYWSRACYGDGSGCVGYAELARSPVLADRPVDGADGPYAIVGHDRDSGTTYVLRDTVPGTDCRGDPDVPGGTCELVAMRPAFTPRPR